MQMVLSHAYSCMYIQVKNGHPRVIPKLNKLSVVAGCSKFRNHIGLSKTVGIAQSCEKICSDAN